MGWEPFQLLVLVSCFTVKSQLMLWNTGILQKGLLPTIEKLFSKAEQSDVIFQQDNENSMPTLQRTTESTLVFIPTKHYTS